MSIQSNFPNIKPSLLLDFANTKQLDNRVTFTRSTPAVYYDGKTTAMAEQNIFQQSQTFDNAYWLKFQGTITANTTTAPDGTSTADTFAEGSGGVTPSLYVNAGPKQVNETFTLSIYAKANGRNYFWLKQRAGADNYIVGVYDLSAPSVSKTQAGTGDIIISTSITSVGSGWYRLTLTGFTGGTNNSEILFGLSDTGTPAIDVEGNIAAYTGNGTSGAYVWGAQFEQRSTATAYTVTTTQPITNYIPVLLTAGGNQARFDCNPTTGESLGLLIEEQRTNTQVYSSNFNDNSWTALYFSAITANTIISPDGTLTGDKLIPDTSNIYHIIYGQAVSGSGFYTMSAFAKAGGYSRIAIRESNVTGDGALFDLSSGTVISLSNATATITPVGNGWYRCTTTVTWGSGYNLGIAVAQSTDTSVLPSFAGNGFSGVYVWGAQLEAGAFATSYIATTSASATRTADAASMTGTNFSSWYNNAEWTLYTEAAWTNIIDSAVVSIDDNSFNAVARVTVYETGLAPSIYSNNAFQFNVNTQLPTIRDQFYKTSLAAKPDNFAAITNTNAINIDNSGVLFNNSPFQMLIGRSFYGSLFTGRIKKIAYYPLRLSNTNLQALTS